VFHAGNGLLFVGDKVFQPAFFFVFGKPLDNVRYFSHIEKVEVARQVG
jgi:hypothetical protein